jgi:hypothetical protein
MAIVATGFAKKPASDSFAKLYRLWDVSQNVLQML